MWNKFPYVTSQLLRHDMIELKSEFCASGIRLLSSFCTLAKLPIRHAIADLFEGNVFCWAILPKCLFIHILKMIEHVNMFYILGFAPVIISVLIFRRNFNFSWEMSIPLYCTCIPLRLSNSFMSHIPKCEDEKFCGNTNLSVSCRNAINSITHEAKDRCG